LDNHFCIGVKLYKKKKPQKHILNFQSKNIINLRLGTKQMFTVINFELSGREFRNKIFLKMKANTILLIAGKISADVCP